MSCLKSWTIYQADETKIGGFRSLRFDLSRGRISMKKIIDYISLISVVCWVICLVITLVLGVKKTIDVALLVTSVLLIILNLIAFIRDKDE